MLARLVTFGVVMAIAQAVPLVQYPAGVDPKACPNYPDCSNPAVAVSQNAPQQYQAVPQYNQYQAPVQYQQIQPAHLQVPHQPQYNPQPQAPDSQHQYSSEIQQALDRGEYIGDGDYHGEGLAESLAPGYEKQPAIGQYSVTAAPPTQYSQSPAYHQYSNTPPASYYTPTTPAPVVRYTQPHYSQSPAQYSPTPVQYNQSPQLFDSASVYNAAPTGVAHNAAPQQQALLPAGVDPNSCPNYPFCH